MLYRIYRGAGTGLFCLGYPVLYLLSRTGLKSGGEILQRTGYGLSVSAEKNAKQPRIWFHAASVGEVAGVDKLIRALTSEGDRFEFILTTMTVHGRDVAVKQLPSEVACYLAPLDIPWVVRSYIDKIRPDLYICLETELWPVLLGELKKAGIKAVLLNGRMTESSCKRYRLVRGLMAGILGVFSELAVIREIDRERFAGLGAAAELIRVTGNIKYDYPPVDIQAVRQKYRTMLRAEGYTVFVTGSTRSGEEEMLSEVCRDLATGSSCRFLWVVAPRHLDRLAEVEQMLSLRGLKFDRYTELADKGRQYDIVLVDCLGELAELYSAGDHLFVGGSLVNKGGHNIMEAARWGRPVYYGPFIEDFGDAAEILEQEGGGFRVADSRSLTIRLRTLMKNPDDYRQACSGALRASAMQCGAGARQAGMVKDVLKKSEIPWMKSTG